MFLLTHILIACASIIFTTYLFIAPSKAKFTVNYSLIALTLISGTYLVVSTHANMLQSCVTGLVYVLAVTLGTIAARYKFTRGITLS
jgi:uncharacterized membrane protein